MAVNCYETEYKNYGKCICLENGIIKLIATIDLGPRIIYFGLCGKENILFEDCERNFSEKNGNYGTWYSYGGHRLWVAPEELTETYYPDNEKVAYSYENNTLTLIQPETPFKKQLSIVCKMADSENYVSIENKIKNCSDNIAHFAPWSITALAPAGVEIIPLNTADSGFLPNRAISFWSYTDIYDNRFKLFNHAAILKHDSSCNKAFKVGFNVNDGYCAYILRNQLFIKNFGSYENVKYPDFSSNFETYTNNYFLECELVGEERDYKPSEVASISETWEIMSFEGTIPQDNEQVTEFLNKHKSIND